MARRAFLERLAFCTPALLPAPLRSSLYAGLFPAGPSGAGVHHAFDPDGIGDFRVHPDYPSPSPLEEMLRLVAPGSDAYATERYAAEIQARLDSLRAWLQRRRAESDREFAQLLHPALAANSLLPGAAQRVEVRNGVALARTVYDETPRHGRDRFVEQLKSYLSSLGVIEIAEFEIVGVHVAAGSLPTEVQTDVRYTLVGGKSDGSREQRIGLWRIHWSHDAASNWLATKWIFTTEAVAKTTAPLFADVSSTAFAGVESYRTQLLHGVDHWRSVLDAASGIDVYGNNGIAAGDFDGDGRDDIYICQPSGLPNRLYRNRGDGAFEDVTEQAGVGVLDATACALFADFENKGLQDLLVVTASGPLLFLNRGDGRFQFKENAFAFAAPPQGTFTHAATADYDRDGRLDVYFCLYSYYLGLDQYHYPSPYYDARNGPPNFLFRNEGGGKFTDRTAASGLSAENDRFSFACAWGEIAGNGGPDLYVANDFGRSNLYRNNGDGTFACVSEDAGVNVPGAGMSACWFDSANSGKQDIYVSNMWSAAGQRVSRDDLFHGNDTPAIRSAYQGHARGNSFYRNRGAGKFESVAESSGVAMGRWAWSADAWDFDHDGYADLYIANGYISGRSQPELSSFFWRQVVGNSTPDGAPSTRYERGWNAINELVRSDHSWAGHERNTFYRNNRDGTLADISGVSGLDLIEDSRAFALADLDGDGRLEVVVKNRTAPQVRILRNAMKDLGNAVSFRLRGTKSNRDAIGAALTVHAGELRQTKYLQAGTGFLSQHSKELFFGLGNAAGNISVSVRWPNGLIQEFRDVPQNHRVNIREGDETFSVAPFLPSPTRTVKAGSPFPYQDEDPNTSTWLLEPLPAPAFSLSDLSGKITPLAAFRGKPLLLYFWAAASPQSVQLLRELQRRRAAFSTKNLQLLPICMRSNATVEEVRSLAQDEKLTAPILLATPEVAGVYNILYRYLFDRRRDLPLPCSFLVDESSQIVKIYQGQVAVEEILSDAASIPASNEARMGKALPFPGKLYAGQFTRNDFTYGVALFQHGYLDSAAESFRQVVAAQPENAEAFYNLGTLYLRKNELPEARRNLEQTVKLRPVYPEAWNNLGMIAAQTNQNDEAVRHFKQSLAQRPDYVTALLNLGNVYRRQGNISDSTRLLTRAAELEPENAEANYSLGMLYARENDLARATDYLRKSVALRPDYPDAVNNLGVLYVREGKQAEAEQQFAACIRVAPNFDQAYLNLARLYMLQQQKEKARATLETLLKLQPDHQVARQALGMLN